MGFEETRMTDLREAYRVMQAECGIEVGDIAKPLRKAESHEMGWENNWCSEMTKMIGNKCLVTDISKYGITLRDKTDDRWEFPFFVLEIIEKEKLEPPPIMVGGHRKVKFIYEPFPVIEVCGITVHKKTLQAILERLEN